ncbi:sugar ABC transporter permease [Anabaena sp. FACHB-709]|uniref:Uncharacterized protein n=2 Tax=Nostocaceae TaxID=1162 RepID=A0A1Z4KP15_ANAVA|nr:MULTISPECIES: hypothetical protein [Nostocaceae]BAY70623.1 hypothetical protein NIES23_34300 [Trichormus variabilis NIES-23]HBW31854.1 sugar ABC transporter permease [Nostoc sp. UBA8866]MBD2172588.1 sugar ABC transporter permease [Anabaena cylindrica FACHB-318]MBD2264440.1 sugar ABC transporter permease [Anabaena sp. FACHB-709]MBD2274211.1 sugar ABC transporter permease [Nostoc sp. PCC 7120 = FACHB-418]
METTSQVQITISLNEPGLDDAELQEKVQNLLPQLREVDGVEDAALVPITEVPTGSKALGGFSPGKFTALVSPALIKPLFDFLGRGIGRNLELDIEITKEGAKFRGKANSKEDIEYIKQKTEELINQARNNQDSNNG